MLFTSGYVIECSKIDPIDELSKCDDQVVRASLEPGLIEPFNSIRLALRERVPHSGGQ